MSDEGEKSVAVRADHSVASPGALLSAMLELARDPSFDVSKFEALANLQLKMEDRQAERDLTRDLQAIQRAIPPVEKNGKIPKKDKNGNVTFIPFADYIDIMTHVQPLLDEYGMTVSFTSRFENTKIVVTGVLRHPAGAQMTSEVPLPIDEGPGRNLTQAHVSTITYGKRAAVRELFNIKDKGADDDGRDAHLKLMTEEQVTELVEMLKAGGGSEAALLTHFYSDQYHSLDEVPTTDFTMLRMAIDARNRAAAAKAKKGETP